MTGGADLLLALHLCLASLANEPIAVAETLPTVDELVGRVASSWDSLRVELRIRMTIQNDDDSTSVTDLLVHRAERGRTRVEFLSPEADSGKVLLQIGADTWLHLPRGRKLVKIPARRSPLAGGVLFEDLFPGAGGLAGAVVERSDGGIVLVAPGSHNGGIERIHFDPDTLLPVRREIYGSKQRLLRTVAILRTRIWSGVPIPWEVRFTDHLRHGMEVHMEVVEARELTGDVDRLFSREQFDQGRSTATDGE